MNTSTASAPSLAPHATGASVVQDRLYGLLSMPLFSGVATADLRALLEVAQWVELAPGEQLENTRPEGTSVVMVVEGAVDAHYRAANGGYKNAILGRGMTVGRAALGRRYNDDVLITAITPAAALTVDIEAIIELGEARNPAGDLVQSQLERMPF